MSGIEGGIGFDEVEPIGLMMAPEGKVFAMLLVPPIGLITAPGGSPVISGVMAEVPISFASLPRSVVIIPLWQFLG